MSEETASALRSRARAWVEAEVDEDDRQTVQDLLDAEDDAGLRALFAEPLAFGTAGLRGPVQPGPAGMNRAVVRRTSAALAAWLDEQDVEGPVVVGRDARHGSAAFAADTAAVLTGAGRTALVLPRPLPTPVLAFAVRHLGCAAGVMVTASHNPAADNGYKVYLRDGAQLVAPHDGAVARHLHAVGAASALPTGSTGDVLGDDVVHAYLDAVASLVPAGPREVRLAYTPLHGVGRDVALAALARAGFAPPAVVPEQADPDPAFPTVSFPNPEEEGALDRGLALAAETGADLLLAHDPDADRLAVAVPLPSGRWRALSGDELGCVVAEDVLARTSGADRVAATTVVSATLLPHLAAEAGAQAATTLTGFKHLARAGDGRGRLVVAYEEALGLAVGDDRGLVVRDKDGIGAALVVAALAARLRAEGRTLLDVLDGQARRHGLHATRQLSSRMPDPPAAVARLRDAPPTTLAGVPVHEVVDLADPAASGLPPTDGVLLRLADDARVVVRPSGTEPKLKAYLQVVRQVPAGADVEAERVLASEQLDGLVVALREVLTPPA